MALGAIAHRKLDAEIDAEADKQHGEGDRYHVQRADHHEAERGGDRQADEQIDEHRDDDARRLQAPATGSISTTTTVPRPLTSAPCCTVANSSSAIGTEPVSRTRAWYFAASSRSLAGLADGVAGALARLQRRKIQHRMHFDQPPQIARLLADGR